jgi:hypothetical protein
MGSPPGWDNILASWELTGGFRIFCLNLRWWKIVKMTKFVQKCIFSKTDRKLFLLTIVFLFTGILDNKSNENVKYGCSSKDFLWILMISWDPGSPLNSRAGSSLPCLGTCDTPLGPPSTPAEICLCTCLQSHLETSPPAPQKSYTNVLEP